MDKNKKYNGMIKKLELLEKQHKQLEFKIKRLKESIDEFETNHLYIGLNMNLNMLINDHDDNDKQT
jgi:hypothetical protein